MKRITKEASEITQLETTFRDISMMWYMKCKETVPVGQTRSLTEIKRHILMEFHNPKLES
jgi:hypothetical protein